MLRGQAPRPPVSSHWAMEWANGPVMAMREDALSNALNLPLFIKTALKTIFHHFNRTLWYHHIQNKIDNATANQPTLNCWKQKIYQASQAYGKGHSTVFCLLRRLNSEQYHQGYLSSHKTKNLFWVSSVDIYEGFIAMYQTLI